MRDRRFRSMLPAFAVALLALAGAIQGCEDDSDLEDAAEEAGDAIEDTADDIDDAVDDAADDIDDAADDLDDE